MLFALTDSDFPLLQAVIGISISINSQWKIWNGTEIFQMLVCRAFFILCWLGPPLYRGTCVWCRALIAAIHVERQFTCLGVCEVVWYGGMTIHISDMVCWLQQVRSGLQRQVHTHTSKLCVCVWVPACVNTQHTSVSFAHTGGNFCLVVYGV